MRNIVLGSLSTALVLACATPAAAQYYERGYGYNVYGYNRAYGDTSGLQRRIYNVLRSLDGVRPDRREQLREEAISLNRSLRYAARNGLNPYEERTFDARVNQLERQLSWASMNRGYGYQNYGYERGNGYYQGRGHGRGHHDEGDDDDGGDR